MTSPSECSSSIMPSLQMTYVLGERRRLEGRIIRSAHLHHGEGAGAVLAGHVSEVLGYGQVGGVDDLAGRGDERGASAWLRPCVWLPRLLDADTPCRALSSPGKFTVAEVTRDPPQSFVHSTGYRLAAAPGRLPGESEQGSAAARSKCMSAAHTCTHPHGRRVQLILCYVASPASLRHRPARLVSSAFAAGAGHSAAARS